MQIPDWTQSATAVKSVTFDIGFWISEFFEYQVPTNKKRKHKQQLCTQRKPLYQPCLKLYSGHNGQPFILSQTLQKAYDFNGTTEVEELITYYLNVIRLSQETQSKAWLYYFAISPIFYSSNDFEVILDDHAYGRKIEKFLKQFSIPEHGLFLWGIDQSWLLDVYATPNQVFFQRTIVGEQESVCVVCDRQQFTQQIPPLRERTTQILHELRAAIGEDYWTD